MIRIPRTHLACICNIDGITKSSNLDLQDLIHSPTKDLVHSDEAVVIVVAATFAGSKATTSTIASISTSYR